jgi:hypothetical protein
MPEFYAARADRIKRLARPLEPTPLHELRQRGRAAVSAI